MEDADILKGKRILIVDDEPDILETLEDLLSTASIDSAPTFETGKKFLDRNTYDLAIFDIMGVKGYDLLRIATRKGIPTVMLTAHALSPDNLLKSIREGAQSYIPKDKLPDIVTFIIDILKEHKKESESRGRWFARLKPFFDKQFGDDWREKDQSFWDEFEDKKVVGKKDLEDML
jgi:DNA-binding response OmpR family regulator